MKIKVLLIIFKTSYKQENCKKIILNKLILPIKFYQYKK